MAKSQPKSKPTPSADASPPLMQSQIELLSAIASTGSISQAAKRIGISYKTAWHRVAQLQNAMPQALLQKTSGGAQGGGSTLTPFARQLLDSYSASESARQHYLTAASRGAQPEVAEFLQQGVVVSSARNQFAGSVTSIVRGAVNAEVALDIGIEQTLSAMVTLESVRRMQLKKRSRVSALIKSSSVILAPIDAATTSAGNHIPGSVVTLERGAVNSEVLIDIGAHKTICATVTNASVKALGLHKGKPLQAMFQSSSVLLMRRL